MLVYMPYRLTIAMRLAAATRILTSRVVSYVELLAVQDHVLNLPDFQFNSCNLALLSQ